MKYLRTAMLIMAKSGKLIKVFKSLKLLKAVTSFISMAIFAVCYSAAMGISLAITFTVLLLIHEMGHVYALCKRGYPLRLPLFIPCVGAVIFAEKTKCRDEEAYIGMGGPLIGTMASLVVGIPYLFTGNKFWALAAFIGVILNLFNMIPISPLDGGRITQAVHPWFKAVGFFLLLGLTMYSGEPGMLLIWIAVVVDLDKMRWDMRFKVAGFIWVLMFAMTVCGVGKQPITNIIDTACGLILIVPMIVMYIEPDIKKSMEKEFNEQNQFNKERKPCTTEQRVGWGLSWAGLTLFQIVAVSMLATIVKPPPKPEPYFSESQYIDLHTATNLFFYSNTWITGSATNIMIMETR